MQSNQFSDYSNTQLPSVSTGHTSLVPEPQSMMMNWGAPQYHAGSRPFAPPQMVRKHDIHTHGGEAQADLFPIINLKKKKAVSGYEYWHPV